MENRIRLVTEHFKNVSLRGKSWRLISIVRERYLRRSEIRGREQAERDARRQAEREINARMIKII